jgi:hypothetical protein
MNRRQDWTRRHFLRGMGTLLALPALESATPAGLRAASGDENEFPLRMAYMFVPNGIHMPDWTPSAEGSNFELPKILNSLEPIKRDLTILTGLTHDKGRANGDGAGDHARSSGVFLTGVQPLKSEGAEIRAGISADQIVAKAVGHQTRFASLELGAESGRQSGKCDSGYSCAYSNNISWRDASTPMSKEVNPRLVFERLFGNRIQSQEKESQARRKSLRGSILDFVMEDAHRLEKRIGYKDKQKLNEYLTAVREIEQRVERSDREKDHADHLLDFEVPEGIPSSYEEHIKLLGDLMILAFQADVTRVATFMLANEGSNRSYRPIGVNEGHHSLSHHQNDPVKLAKISEINTFHVRQASYMLQKMKSIPEGDGSLLDHCMVLYGAGISDGNRHNNENLPLFIAGKGNGCIRPGRHIRYEFETPMSNLLLSMIHHMGAKADRLGDSTGLLRGLEG